MGEQRSRPFLHPTLKFARPAPMIPLVPISIQGAAAKMRWFVKGATIVNGARGDGGGARTGFQSVLVFGNRRLAVSSHDFLLCLALISVLGWSGLVWSGLVWSGLVIWFFILLPFGVSLVARKGKRGNGETGVVGWMD